MKFPRPMKRVNDQLESVTSEMQVVSERVIALTTFGMIAFSLISVVAVTALLIALAKDAQ